VEKKRSAKRGFCKNDEFLETGVNSGFVEHQVWGEIDKELGEEGTQEFLQGAQNVGQWLGYSNCGTNGAT